MTEPTPLDPDERPCPRCHVQPGEVCRTPAGKKSVRMHADRKRAPGEPRPGNKTPHATAESRAKGGRASQAALKARREKLAAEREEKRRELEAEALKAEAGKLAQQAASWDRRRMALREDVLGVAGKAWTTVSAELDALRRVKLDEHGQPVLFLDTTDPENPKMRPETTGYALPKDIQALMVSAAVALDKLRLEEGAATSRHEQVSGDRLGDLAERSLRDVAGRVVQMLDEGLISEGGDDRG